MPHDCGPHSLVALMRGIRLLEDACAEAGFGRTAAQLARARASLVEEGSDGGRGQAADRLAAARLRRRAATGNP
jgi:hypothetical protein